MNILRLIVRKMINLPRKIRLNYYRFWNKFWLYLNGVEYGNNLNITSSVYFRLGVNSKITIGNNYKLTSGECINPLCRNVKGCLVTKPNAQIIIGDNVGMSSPCIWAHSKIVIGDNVKIGGDTILMDSDAHSLDYMDRRFFNMDNQNKKDIPIYIENDVLIGTKCIILKGVRIGARSVIGSGSIVTKSIPSDCIAVGNPCKVIKYNNI